MSVLGKVELEPPPLQVVPLDSAGRNLVVLVDFADVNRRPLEYAEAVKLCDLCRCDLAEQGLFVDGRLRSDSRWANMCPRCFESNGASIGWGKGQLFAKQSDGQWRLVSGFSPE